VPLSSAQASQPLSGLDDLLNDLVANLAAQYKATISWTTFVKKFRGDEGDFHPEVKSITHAAAPLLDQLRVTGAPVVLSTPPWSMHQKQEALKRGARQSANVYNAFLRGEFATMIKKKQWILLLAKLVLAEAELRLSPLGVLPQWDRRPRSNIDYSFYCINDDTVLMAPPEAMQFGKALWRILSEIVRSNPCLGPVYFSKVDIADGFYRIWVQAANVPKLGVLLLIIEGQERLIGFPLVLTVGWKESPPIFTAATKTITDLANVAIKEGVLQKPHRLELVAETDSNIISSLAQRQLRTDNRKWQHVQGQQPVGQWDVYINEFIGMVQVGKARRRCVKRALLHSLDKVLRGLSSTDGPFRQEPVSIKKTC
jgi:hypothetical protein